MDPRHYASEDAKYLVELLNRVHADVMQGSFNGDSLTKLTWAAQTARRLLSTITGCDLRPEEPMTCIVDYSAQPPVFRCTVCNGSKPCSLPMAISQFQVLAKQFQDEHRGCSSRRPDTPPPPAPSPET